MSAAKKFAGWLLAAALCAAVGPVRAALSENLATTVESMSLGNAVTANPEGVIDAIHFNPAGLARMKGTQVSIGGFAAVLRASAHFEAPPGFDIGGWTDDPVAGTSTGKFRQTLYIPGVGPAHFPMRFLAGGNAGISFNKPGSPFTFATAFYIPQAVGYDRRSDPNDPARFDGQRTVIQRLTYFSPTVGYQASDTLSLGVGVGFSHSAFALDTELRMPNQLLGIVGKLQQGFCPDGGGNPIDTLGLGLCGGGPDGMISPFKRVAKISVDASTPLDLTMNLGLLWQPSPKWSLGVGYRGGSRTVLSGSYELNADPMIRQFASGLYNSLFGPVAAATLGIPKDIPPVQSGRVQAIVPYPPSFQLGTTVRPWSWLQLSADAVYTRWSEWDKLTVKFDRSVTLLEVAKVFGLADSTQLSLPRNYQSRVHFGFGAQWRLNEAVSLRLGYEPRKSSIPNSAIDLIAPLPDMTVRSVGLKYRWGPDIDVAMTYTQAKGKYNVPANTSCNMNCNKLLNVIYNPYAGLDVTGTTSLYYFGTALTMRF